MIKCANCGAECADSTKFCQNCGTKIPQDKECPICHARVALAAKFCPECGHRFGGDASAADPSGMAIGDKNVIAGDVVGRQENIKVTGSATIVKNEDETRKMVKCHVCGRNIPITRSVDCPVCGETTCESCFDASRKSCVACISKENANREEVYLNALRKALEDGVMTLAKRQELNALQRELGIGEARAAELEDLTKKGAKAAKDTSTLSSYVRLSLQKALDVLYDEGDAQKAYDDLLPIYRRYSGNEEVLIGFLNAALKVNRKEAFDIIRRNRADVAGMHLVCIDSDLENGELASADERLTAATRLWPDDLLIKCRRIMCLVAMYDKLQDGLFLKQAAEILSSLPEPQNKLESSWACRVRIAVRKGMGEKADRITRAYCREHDLYFAVASGGGRDPDELYRQALAMRKTDIASCVKLLSELADDGFPDAQYTLGDCYFEGDGVEQDYAAAAECFRKAAEQDHLRAQSDLGYCYEQALGVDRDLAEAVKYYRKSAEQGHAAAQRHLGACFHDGRGVEQDYAEAVKWYRQAAEQGDAKAQYALGNCYHYGEGVEQDHTEATSWYRKAAEQGHAAARDRLNDRSGSGPGVDSAGDDGAFDFDVRSLVPRNEDEVEGFLIVSGASDRAVTVKASPAKSGCKLVDGPACFRTLIAVAAAGPKRGIISVDGRSESFLCGRDDDSGSPIFMIDGIAEFDDDLTDAVMTVRQDDCGATDSPRFRSRRLETWKNLLDDCGDWIVFNTGATVSVGTAVCPNVRKDEPRSGGTYTRLKRWWSGL